jgi:hypothetical protein
LASLALSEYVYRNRYDDYKAELSTYRLASRNLTAEAQAWQKLQKSHDDLRSARQTRNVCAAAAAAIYLYNVLDSYINFPRNLRQIEIVPLSGSGTDVSANVSGIQLCWSF